MNRRDKEHIPRKVLRTDIAWKGREDDGKQDENTRQETCWTESGRGDGQGEMELYRRPYMTGTAREKKKEHARISVESSG